MGDSAVEMIADVGAAWAAFLPVGAEHEVVDEELAVGAEEVGEGGFAVGGVEGVFFFDAGPGELAALTCDVIADAGVLFFFGEEGFAGGEPLVGGDDFVFHDLLQWERGWTRTASGAAKWRSSVRALLSKIAGALQPSFEAFGHAVAQLRREKTDGLVGELDARAFAFGFEAILQKVGGGIGHHERAG